MKRIKYTLNRSVDQKECNWLGKTYEKGSEMDLYMGEGHGTPRNGFGFFTTSQHDIPTWVAELPMDAMELQDNHEIKKELLDQFKTEVYDRSDSIDPDDLHEWDTLAYGWLIGKGAPVEMAELLSHNALTHCYKKEEHDL